MYPDNTVLLSSGSLSIIDVSLSVCQVRQSQGGSAERRAERGL